MRWKWIGIAALLVVVGAGASVTLRAEKKGGKNAAEADQTKANKSSREAASSELIAIIQETESEEAFTTALYALVALRPNDKTIVPLAIRHAERIGLMKGMYGEEQSATQQAFGDALDLLLGDDIQKIEKGRPGPANGGAPAGGRVRFTPGGPIGPP